MSEHIYKQFDAEMEAVRARVLEMGGLVEEQVNKAVDALIAGNAAMAEEVIANDHRVNALEVAVDEACTNIIARRQPTAGDLRMILTIIKTITDLERIGDEGEKIGMIASRLASMERPPDKYRSVKHLGRLVGQMVHDALDAFARMDAQSALRTVRDDKAVDEEYESIQRQCMTFMMEDPRSITRVMEIMWVVRAMERIGDHAKNICEYIIYMVHGTDVRHTSLEDVALQLASAQNNRR